MRKPGLNGTNLWRDPRTGVYVWRRKHALTGKRFRRSTGTKGLRIALSQAQKFEEEYQREIAGLSNFGDYRRPVMDFLEPFLASVASDRRRKRLRADILRAFRLLDLRRLADLEDFIKVEQRLLKLEGTEPGQFSRRTLAKTFQSSLKQFSTYLAGRREILADHLAAWPSLKIDTPPRKRRALMPEEFVRILAASDRLDAINARKNPTRMVWTALLIAAPRISALTALDVKDLDRVKGRLLFKGKRNKRAGAGALDSRTLAELVDYVGDRTDGPLILAPEGGRIDSMNSLDRWKSAVSLAMVDFEWPEGEPRDLWLAYLVHYALFTGRVQVVMGGPLTGPNAPGPKKHSRREALAAKVRGIADAMRPAWRGRMQGVDQHCLRMTHRTWALVAGVPEILIDKQLGHASPAGEAALRAAWSAVGRAHYTDMNFLALDAKRSAEAVRGALDRAEADLAEVVEKGQTAFGAPRREKRLGKRVG